MGYHNWAYDFECDEFVDQIIAILNEAGPWKWIEWSSDNFGDYAFTSPGSGAKVRILDISRPGRHELTYKAEVQIFEDSEVERDLIDGILQEQLKLLKARTLRIGETYY